MTIPLTKAELHLESHLHQGLGRSVSSESKSSQCSAEPASDMNSDCDCEDDYDYYDDNLQVRRVLLVTVKFCTLNTQCSIYAGVLCTYSYIYQGDR